MSVCHILRLLVQKQMQCGPSVLLECNRSSVLQQGHRAYWWTDFNMSGDRDHVSPNYVGSNVGFSIDFASDASSLIGTVQNPIKGSFQNTVVECTLQISIQDPFQNPFQESIRKSFKNSLESSVKSSFVCMLSSRFNGSPGIG